MGGGAYARFFMRIEKLLGRGGGYTQIFGVYSNNITASGGGGGLCQIFLCVIEKKLGGGLYPNFWCVLK